MFDAMIAVGIMAIDIEDVIANIWLLIAACVIGTIVAFFYVCAATNHAYKGYAERLSIASPKTAPLRLRWAMIFAENLACF